MSNKPRKQQIGPVCGWAGEDVHVGVFVHVRVYAHERECVFLFVLLFDGFLSCVNPHHHHHMKSSFPLDYFLTFVFFKIS